MNSNIAALLIMLFALALFILLGVMYLVYREARRNALRKRIHPDGDVHFVDEDEKTRIIIKRTPPVEGDASHLGEIASQTIEAMNHSWLRIIIDERARETIDRIRDRINREKSQKGKQHHGTKS